MIWYDDGYYHDEESSDYVIKYVADDGEGTREEFDAPQRAAKFILYCCRHENASITEVVYASEKNYRIGSPMFLSIFWSGWADGKNMLKEIVIGKIPKVCASSYTKYCKAIMKGAEID